MDFQDDSTFEEDDEWFDSTIKNYKELLMLEIENLPLRLTLSGHSNIFILEEKTSSSQILSYYKLPGKICDLGQSIVKTSHLEVLSGTYLDAVVTQIQGLGGGQLIASEAGCCGLRRFSVSSLSDKILKEPEIFVANSLSAPNFCQIDEDTFILTKNTKSSAHLLRSESNSTEDLKIKFTSATESEVVPVAISKNLVAFGAQTTGEISVYDVTREKNPVITIKDPISTSNCKFTSAYRPTSPSTESTRIALISDSGFAEVYDLKFPRKPIASRQLTSGPTTIGIAPNEKFLSVSDHRGHINIYGVSSNEMEQVFSHEGHVKVKQCKRTPQVTDHLWFSNSTVISAADNKTVNLWQFCL